MQDYYILKQKQGFIKHHVELEGMYIHTNDIDMAVKFDEKFDILDALICMFEEEEITILKGRHDTGFTDEESTTVIEMIDEIDEAVMNYEEYQAERLEKGETLNNAEKDKLARYKEYGKLLSYYK